MVTIARFVAKEGVFHTTSTNVKRDSAALDNRVR